jgi:hypothetical protein
MSPKLLEQIQSPAESFESTPPSQEQIKQQYDSLKIAAEAISQLPAEATEQDKLKIVLEKAFGITASKDIDKKDNALTSFAKKNNLIKKSSYDLIAEEDLPLKLSTLKQINEYLVNNGWINNIDAAGDIPLFIAVAMVGITNPVVSSLLGVVGAKGLYKNGFEPAQNRDIMEVKPRAAKSSMSNHLAHLGVRLGATALTVLGASTAVPAMFAPQPMIMDAHLEQLKDKKPVLIKAVEDREASAIEMQDKNYKEKKARLDTLTAGRAEAKAKIAELEAKKTLTADEKITLTNVKGRFLNAKFGGAAEIAKLTKELDIMEKNLPEIQSAKAFRKQSTEVLQNFQNAIQQPANRNVLETVVEDITKWDAIANWTNLEKSIGFGDKLQLALKETEKNPYGFYLATAIFSAFSAAGLIMGKSLKNNPEFAVSRQVEYREKLESIRREIEDLLMQFAQNQLEIAVAMDDPKEKFNIIQTLKAQGLSIEEVKSKVNNASKSVEGAKQVRSLISSSAYNSALKIANSYRQGLVGGKLSEVDQAFISQKDANGSKENQELQTENQLIEQFKNGLRKVKKSNSVEEIIDELDQMTESSNKIKSKAFTLNPIKALRNLRGQNKTPKAIENQIDALNRLKNLVEQINETTMSEDVKLAVTKEVVETVTSNPDQVIKFGEIKDLVEGSSVLNPKQLQNMVDNISERRHSPEETQQVDKLVRSLALFQSKNIHPKKFTQEFSKKISQALMEIGELESVTNKDNTDPKILLLKYNLQEIHSAGEIPNEPEATKDTLKAYLQDVITIYNKDKTDRIQVI